MGYRKSDGKIEWADGWWWMVKPNGAALAKRVLEFNHITLLSPIAKSKTYFLDCHSKSSTVSSNLPPQAQVPLTSSLFFSFHWSLNQECTLLGHPSKPLPPLSTDGNLSRPSWSSSNHIFLMSSGRINGSCMYICLAHNSSCLVLWSIIDMPVTSHTLYIWGPLWMIH